MMMGWLERTLGRASGRGGGNGRSSENEIVKLGAASKENGAVGSFCFLSPHRALLPFECLGEVEEIGFEGAPHDRFANDRRVANTFFVADELFGDAEVEFFSRTCLA